MFKRIPIPPNWRQSYNGKVYGPSTVLRLSHVFVLVVAFGCFCFGMAYYGTRTIQEFEISSIDLTGTDGWACSSIASIRIEAELLSGISGYVRENDDGIAHVLPETFQAKKLKRRGVSPVPHLYYGGEEIDENYDPDSTRLKRMMASIDYHPTSQEKSENNRWYKSGWDCMFYGDCGFTYDFGINYNIFPLSNGYFVDVGSPLSSASVGEWTPDGLSTMKLDTLQAPTVEECVEGLVEASCTLNDDFVVDTGDAGKLKLYRFTLSTMKSFETCNQSYYEKLDDAERETVGLFEYVWAADRLNEDGCNFDPNGNSRTMWGVTIGNESFKGIDNQYIFDWVWGAPTLSLVDSDSRWSKSDYKLEHYQQRFDLPDMSDQIDGWYVMVQHRGPEKSVCDNLDYVDGGTGYYRVMARSVDWYGNDWYEVAGKDLKCEQIASDICIVDATNQFVAKQGDIPLGTTISKKDPFQTRLYLALSDAQGETCSDRWTNVCKTHHNFESICEGANIAPYKCERSVSLGLLSTLSLSWSAVQLVLTVLIFSFGIIFGKFCKLQHEDGAAEEEMNESLENAEVIAGATTAPTDGNTGGNVAEEAEKESNDVEIVEEADKESNDVEIVEM